MSLVPDVVLIFKLNEERKELNYRKLPFSAWTELKASLGFTPMTLLSAVSDFDLEAIGGVIWMERKQHEKALRWNDVRRELERDDATFESVGVIVDGVTDMMEDEEAAPDPTT